jgi:hypothetical protein
MDYGRQFLFLICYGKALAAVTACERRGLRDAWQGISKYIVGREG